MTSVKAGEHLHSLVCTTEVIVTKAPTAEVVIACGGQPMVGKKEKPTGATAGVAVGTGTLMGKRYADGGSGLELLCVRPGGGDLTVNGEPLPIAQARPLPASD